MGRLHATVEDIQALAKPVLRHRVMVNYSAESEGITTDDVIDRIMAVTPSDENELTRDARLQKVIAS